MSDALFRGLADPTRRAMIELLQAGDKTAAELAAPFAMSRPAVSQHLAVLLAAGLVDVEAVGRQRVYSLRRAPLGRLAQWARRVSADRRANSSASHDFLAD